jgi:hypothetical protein
MMDRGLRGSAGARHAAAIGLVLLVILGPRAALRARADEFAAPASRDTTGTAHPEDEDAPASVTHMLVAGAASGAVGFLIGALIGGQVADDDDGGADDLDSLAGAFVGGSILGGLAVPLGVNQANDGAGSLPLGLVTSVLVGGAGLLATDATGSAAVLLATPLFQLGACTAVEQLTDPRRDEPSGSPAPGVTVGVGMYDRAPALVVGGRF